MICLIRPPAVEAFRFATTSVAPPLGLAYVAAALEEAGREIRVIDAVAEAPGRHTRYIKGYLVGLTPGEIAARIPAEAGMIGISVIFTHEWPAAVHLIRLIKARRPGVPIVLGGEHVTAMPEFCLATSAADVLVLGEGEETVVALAEALDTRRPLAGIDGLAFRDGDRVVVTPRRARRRDVDAIPRPAWHHFRIMTYHEHRLAGGIYAPHPALPILATRGCPYRCTFCTASNMWSSLWVPREPALVVDEIQHGMERFGARNFPFQDLTAVIRKDWIVAFCRELLRRGLKVAWQFPTGTRCEAIDAEVADLMARSGMIGMSFAPESGSETTRRLVKKRMRTEALFGSIAAAAGAGLNVTVFTIVGFPHETPALAAENLAFVDRLADAGATDLAVAFYMALPGTELFERLYDAGRIRIDRRYFVHMLHNTALVPAQSYSDALGRSALLLLKLRMFLRFYRRKGRLRHDGLTGSLRRALSGFRGGEHSTKLQTAVRNGLILGLNTLKVRFRRGWVPRGEERAMFAGWDAAYRGIRRRRERQGTLPGRGGKA